MSLIKIELEKEDLALINTALVGLMLNEQFFDFSERIKAAEIYKKLIKVKNFKDFEITNRGSKEH